MENLKKGINYLFWLFWETTFCSVEYCFFTPLLAIGIDIKTILRSFSSMVKNGISLFFIFVCLVSTFLLFFVLIFLSVYLSCRSNLPKKGEIRGINFASNYQKFSSAVLLRNEILVKKI